MTKEVLSKELNEAINKSLPHMVGEELKAVLDKAAKDASALEAALKKVKKKAPAKQRA
jgi:hypothetical protein